MSFSAFSWSVKNLGTVRWHSGPCWVQRQIGVWKGLLHLRYTPDTQYGYTLQSYFSDFRLIFRQVQMPWCWRTLAFKQSPTRHKLMIDITVRLPLSTLAWTSFTEQTVHAQATSAPILGVQSTIFISSTPALVLRRLISLGKKTNLRAWKTGLGFLATPGSGLGWPIWQWQDQLRLAPATALWLSGAAWKLHVVDSFTKGSNTTFLVRSYSQWYNYSFCKVLSIRVFLSNEQHFTWATEARGPCTGQDILFSCRPAQ